MDELRALFFGATVAAAIGPIALLIIHNGMRHGLAAALASAAGVAAADFVYAVLAFTAGSQLASLLEHDRQTLALAAARLIRSDCGSRRRALQRNCSRTHAGASARGFLRARKCLRCIHGVSETRAPARWSALYFAAFIFAGSPPVQACYACSGQPQAGSRPIARRPRAQCSKRGRHAVWRLWASYLLNSRAIADIKAAPQSAT
jgi:hypothetical protein